MCGITGIIACADRAPSADETGRARMRDRLRHRGPDGSGDWSDGAAWIGHRRLAIMDPQHGREPFVRGAGDHVTVVVFNGELLNHRDLRVTLEREGVAFSTDCDAETAAAAVHHWGEEALDRFRGMFAIAWYRPRERTLRLARDPFGVVPLMWASVPAHGDEIVFASEMTPILEHPGFVRRVDPITLSGYLSTIRITLGDRTMVDGVRTVRPGGLVTIDCRGMRPRIDDRCWWRPPRATGGVTGADADDLVRNAVIETLEAHLQSDVERCGLLSGGIDSAVLSTLAKARVDPLRTFTALGGDGTADPDREAAAMMARRLGTGHVEVAVAAATETPIARWRRMVRSMGVPLGTPNEIAINALAEAVGAAGIKVAIGGEGADEILGGYEPILRLVAQIAAADPGPEVAAATLLESASWIAPGAKATVLAERWVDSIGHDAALIGELGAAIESGGSAAEPRSYLHWLQTVNLPGLLGRLNAACMLASVEARPPFADRRFAEAVARVDTADLFGPEADGTFRTKTVLRRGFAGQVPAEIVARPKASFPTPFAPWAAAMLADPLVSEAIRPLVRPEVSSVLNGDPAAHPLQAWPLANLGLWAVETGIDLDPS